MSAGSPMVARLGLANFLRESRGSSSAVQAAAVAGFSKATLSRVERGETTISPGDAKVLMEHYGVAADTIESILPLAYAAKEAGWWQRYKGAVPDWFSLFIGVETAAHRIRTYEPEWVPGILQTPDYAQSLIEKDVSAPSPDDVQEGVNLRQRRQEKLTGTAPADLGAVVSEAALYRVVGGSRVHREQLQHLLSLSERTNVDLRVLPFTAGSHAASYGSFVILDYTVVQTEYALVYVEYCGGAIYLEHEKEVDLHTHTFASLQADAASTETTRELITRALRSAA
ncbi:DUF5753 domain-containing protein [Streptomonospora arabica]|uniref:DUF5753 domain-containing protein n=1 Tax=Streptomonospora arabica TaxID=412417 RepID=A0ABV9SK79_9ACTN